LRSFTRASFCVVGVEMKVRQNAILEPDRNVAVLCFERVTAISTRRTEPGRNVLPQTEPFAEIALGKPGRSVLMQSEPFAETALGKPSKKTAGRPGRNRGNRFREALAFFQIVPRFSDFQN